MYLPTKGLWYPGKPPFGAFLDHTLAREAGIASCMLLNEGVGPPFDMAAKQVATTTGAPIWTSGPYGWQRGGYSITAYDRFIPVFTTGTYPNWAVALYSTTSPSVWQLIGHGNTGSGNPLQSLILFSSGQVGWQARDNAGTLANLIGTQNFALDGKWHVAMGVSWSASSHQVFLDGVSNGTSAIALGAVTFDNLSMGASIRNAITNYGGGGNIAFAAVGFGAVPDPAVLFRALISGQFPVRPPDHWLYAASAASATGTGTITLGSLFVAGSGTASAPTASTGTGAITLGSLAVAGVGSFTAIASAAITLGSLSVSGAGSFATSASGSITLGSIIVAGAATASAPGTSTGTGSITLGALAIAGAGSFTASASGSITLGSLSTVGAGSATGILATTGTGSITLGSMIVVGVGVGTGILAGADILDESGGSILDESGFHILDESGFMPVWSVTFPDPFASVVAARPDPFASTSTATANPFAASAKYQGSP